MDTSSLLAKLHLAQAVAQRRRRFDPPGPPERQQARLAQRQAEVVAYVRQFRPKSKRCSVGFDGFIRVLAVA